MLIHRVSLTGWIVLYLCCSFLVIPQEFLPQNLVSEKAEVSLEPHQYNLIEELNLTRSQKQQILLIQQKYQNQIDRKRSAIHQSLTELRSLINDDKTTDVQLITKHKQLLTLRQEMRNLGLESMSELQNILTPQQHTKFVAIMQRKRVKTGKQKLTKDHDHKLMILLKRAKKLPQTNHQKHDRERDKR